MSYKLIDLPLRSDKRGNLVFAQEGDHIPFPVKRMFYIYDIPPGAARAGHAHKEQHQYLVMLSGGCEIRIDDGRRQATVSLHSPLIALYAPPLTWLNLSQFAAASTCMVLASDVYDERDYLRDYCAFKRLTEAHETPPRDG